MEVYCETTSILPATKQDDFEVYPLIHEKPKAPSAESTDPSAHSVFVDESTKSEGSCDRHTADPILKGEGEPQRFFALNEMVIARGDQGRMIGFSYSVSDSLIANMRSDGLIVASATGSTGYALSVGGPLVDPSYQGLIVAPIAPHTLQSRALLTGSSDVVEIDLDSSPASRAATLFIDGERITFDSPIRKIVVATGEGAPRSSCAIRQNLSTITPPKPSSSNKGQACLDQRTWADLRSARIARSSTRFYFNLITSM